MTTMTEEITKDLAAAIDKHVPGLLAKQLQDRLATGEKAIEEAAALRAHHDRQEENIAELQNRLRKHKSLDDREKEIEARAGVVYDRERQAQVAELEVKVAAAEQNAKFARDVAMGLVRNVEFRSQAYGSVPMTAPTSGYSGATSETRENTAS